MAVADRRGSRPGPARRHAARALPQPHHHGRRPFRAHHPARPGAGAARQVPRWRHHPARPHRRNVRRGDLYRDARHDRAGASAGLRRRAAPAAQRRRHAARHRAEHQHAARRRATAFHRCLAGGGARRAVPPRAHGIPQPAGPAVASRGESAVQPLFRRHRQAGAAVFLSALPPAPHCYRRAARRTHPRHLPRHLMSGILDRFAAIVGDKYTIRDPAEMAPHLMEPRELYRGRAALVLKPGSTEEVAAILKLASETGTPVVPQGGNTGFVGGQISFDANAVVLSTVRLDKIREIDLATNSMTVEAGVVLARAQEAAAAQGRLFPLALGAEGSATIGGNLSTNAGGTQVLAYGNARDLVLGLEVVLADGRIWRGLRKLKKDNTGYDLRNLFVGAEGTLGIITAAVLKLFPAPRAVETALVGLASPPAALALLPLARERVAGSVTSFELLPRIGIELACRFGGCREPLRDTHPWYVLMELSSQAPEGFRAALEDILAA